MSDGGKGSARRAMSVSDQEYASRWDAIFQRDQPKQSTHFFIHDGWGKSFCRECGKKEDYSYHGEACPGQSSEVK